MTIHFDNSYSRLEPQFFSPQLPTKVAAPKLVKFNEELASEMGISAADLTVNMLSGNDIPAGATPIATAYSGHQFGGFSPQLGDGRAILLGEVLGPDGQRRDLQLKGSGPTMFSRNGDGRATIGAVIREYVISEAMHALGIPTTRALAAVTTGNIVQREKAFPGAILARVASSHIRVGTFQFHYARRDETALQALVDHVISRHYPDADGPVGMLDQVVEKQAKLIAEWMKVGFIHGVMNTDNMSISGETIDYGPCAFMDSYHPDTVFSSIDHQGRYAFSNQPKIALWNLSQLAQTLVPLVGEAGIPDLEAALARFDGLFSHAFADAFRNKIGLQSKQPDDLRLSEALLKILADHAIDFTIFFRRFTDFAEDGDISVLHELFNEPHGLDDWIKQWNIRIKDEAQSSLVALMRASNPVYIPRNHRLEEVIQAANEGNYGPFELLMKVLAQPFKASDEYAAFEAAPKPDEIVQATFCGT